MHPDEKADLEAELQKTNNVLELKPDSEYFQKRKKELEKQLKKD